MPIDPPARMIPPGVRDCAIACLCAGRDPQAAEAARGCLSVASFDWPAFEQVLNVERIAPLIHYRVGTWRLLPEGLGASARQAYLQTAWASSLRMTELERLLRRYEAAGILVMLLKGAALALTVYGNGALRPMCDVDLLVRLPDLERACQVLLAYGYTAFPAMYSSPYQIEFAFTGGQQGEMAVEIHTSLFQVPHLFTPAQMEWFWENTITAQMGRVPVRLLAPEAQVLHLCGHLWLHHQGGDLLGWNDIHEVVCQNAVGMDWDRLLRAAQALDLLIPLQKTLPELARDWRTPIPPDVIARLNGLSPTRHERRKFGRLWWQKYNFAEVLLVDLLSLSGWRDRLRYTLCKLFPQPGYMKARYRQPLPFAYLYRWLSSIIRIRT